MVHTRPWQDALGPVDHGSHHATARGFELVGENPHPTKVELVTELIEKRVPVSVLRNHFTHDVGTERFELSSREAHGPKPCVYTFPPRAHKETVRVSAYATDVPDRPSGGSGIRTRDLEVMGLPSYLTAPPRNE